MVGPPFPVLCKRAAKLIRGGSLHEDSDVSQVEKNSYEWIARINDLGFLTCSSQDGQIDERAFVHGFMTLVRARELTHRLNCSSDKIFIVLQPSPRMESIIPLTKVHLKGCTNIHLYDDMIPSDRQEAGIDPSTRCVKVIAIDAVWSRKAYGKRGLWHDLVLALEAIDHP